MQVNVFWPAPCGTEESTLADFERDFVVQSSCYFLEVKIVAIDGKTLCSSFDKTKCIAALHTTSAWATEARMVLE